MEGIDRKQIITCFSRVDHNEGIIFIQLRTPNLPMFFIVSISLPLIYASLWSYIMIFLQMKEVRQLKLCLVSSLLLVVFLMMKTATPFWMFLDQMPQPEKPWCRLASVLNMMGRELEYIFFDTIPCVIVGSMNSNWLSLYKEQLNLPKPMAWISSPILISLLMSIQDLLDFGSMLLFVYYCEAIQNSTKSMSALQSLTSLALVVPVQGQTLRLTSVLIQGDLRLKRCRTVKMAFLEMSVPVQWLPWYYRYTVFYRLGSIDSWIRSLGHVLATISRMGRATSQPHQFRNTPTSFYDFLFNIIPTSFYFQGRGISSRIQKKLFWSPKQLETMVGQLLPFIFTTTQSPQQVYQIQYFTPFRPFLGTQEEIQYTQSHYLGKLKIFLVHTLDSTFFSFPWYSKLTNLTRPHMYWLAPSESSMVLGAQWTIWKQSRYDAL